MLSCAVVLRSLNNAGSCAVNTWRDGMRGRAPRLHPGVENAAAWERKKGKKERGEKRKKKRWEGEAIKESNPLSRKRKRERRALLHYLAGGPGRGAALGSEGKRPPRPGTFCPRGAALPRRGAVRNPRGRSSAPALTCAAPFSLRFEEQQMRTLPSPPPPPSRAPSDVAFTAVGTPDAPAALMCPERRH